MPELLGFLVDHPQNAEGVEARCQGNKDKITQLIGSPLFFREGKLQTVDENQQAAGCPVNGGKRGTHKVKKTLIQVPSEKRNLVLVSSWTSFTNEQNAGYSLASGKWVLVEQERVEVIHTCSK